MSTSNTTGKTTLNCRNVVIFPMTDEKNETYSETPLNFTGRARNVSDSLTVNSTPLSGDGVVQEVAYGTGMGTLTLALNYLTDEDRRTLFGETRRNGSNITAGNEAPPPVGVAFVTDCQTDGSVVNLYKYFVVRFAPGEESVAQIENGQVSYSTVQIQGSYGVNHTLGIMRAFRRHVNATSAEGKELIKKWLEQAEYIGETTSDGGY